MFSFGNKKVNRRREAKAAAELSRRPKLERRNAVKNIDYDLSWASSSSDESTPLQFTRSLDLSPVFDSSESSFRIGGSIDGEVEHLYLRLGLSGPEDFGIPVDAWEESLKARSSSDLFPRSRFLKSDSLPKKLENSNLAPFLPEESRAEAAVLSKEVGVRLHAVEVAAVLLEETRVGDDESKEILQLSADRNGCNDAGIRVTQLPVVTACPSSAPVLSPPLGRSVLEPTTSITLPVDDRSHTIHEVAFSEVLSEENGFTHPAKVSSLQEEFNVRDKELVEVSQLSSGRRRLRDVGIKGTRPPVLTPPPPASVLPPPPMRSVLAPPPSMTLPIQDRASSPWDIVRSFAPADENEEGDRRRSFDSTVDEEKEDEEAAAEEEVVAEEEGNWVENRRAGEDLERAEMLVETTDGTGSFSTTNEDDSSSTTTEYVISPNGYFKKKIKSWMRGQLLGSGSFGTVYEGISDDGTFIAIKEVSLLDKGSNAKQCILQLEQEIALLSQFEHENIVQYYGTDKEESKLVIFLELVTQGSLASLYQKYHLRDTQVSAYTRQILNGLNYLHERNVVHRDIKCANILVHANGSVKLADFGLAKEISRFSDLKSCKGSVYWMAPEVVHPKKTYGRAADIWSLGCTVLELLTRQIPYPNVEWQHAFYKIGRGDQPPIPNHLSSEAQDFIRNCVQVDPNSRPTAAQLLKHPFVMRPAEAFSY